MFLYPSKSNRNGLCLFYREWLCPFKTLSPQQDHKLMFGLVFSVKFFTTKMDSADAGNLGLSQLPGQGCSFPSFRTNIYKLSFMEGPSGIKHGLANAWKMVCGPICHIYFLLFQYGGFFQSKILDDYLKKKTKFEI
ncbi:hypothetical protein AMTRI_Chr09g43310 [Amborella trichopoda]